MTLKEAFEVVAYLLTVIKQGEIRLYIKNHEITHVNRSEEVFHRDIPDKY